MSDKPEIKVLIGHAYNPQRRVVRTQSGEYRAYRPITGHLSDVRSTSNDRMWDKLVFIAAIGGGCVVILLAALGAIR